MEIEIIVIRLKNQDLKSETRDFKSELKHDFWEKIKDFNFRFKNGEYYYQSITKDLRLDTRHQKSELKYSILEVRDLSMVINNVGMGL